MLWYLSCSIKPIEGETYEDTKVAGLRWYRFLLLQGLDVVAPYWGLLQALDDKSDDERKLGMSIDDLVHERCDGLITVGATERVLQSQGCLNDIKLARSRNELHLDFTSMSEEEVAVFLARLPAQLKRDPPQEALEHSHTPTTDGCGCGDPDCGRDEGDWDNSDWE